MVGVGRYRRDLGVGHGDLREVGGELEVLLVLFRTIVAARECQDQRILALDLAERASDAILVGKLVVGECAAGGDVRAHGASPSGRVMLIGATGRPPGRRRRAASRRLRTSLAR